MKGFARPASALVVGASRGIGRAFVDCLRGDASVGRVFAAARSGASDSALGGLGPKVLALDMDVTDETSVARAAAKVAEQSTGVDLVLNCAGLLHDGARMQPERRLADISPENLARSFAVNASGPLLVAKHFETHFDRTERVVFASLSARVGSIGDNRLGGWYAYRASKAAQNMITRNLAVELRRRARGIVCVALHPGTVETGLSEPFRRNVPDGKLFTAERAACQLLSVIDGLDTAHSGGFFAWDGQAIPW